MDEIKESYDIVKYKYEMGVYTVEDVYKKLSAQEAYDITRIRGQVN